MEFSSITHAGNIRENNEDFHIYDKAKKIFIVADGIGGQRAGEVASKLACDTLLKYQKDNFDNMEAEELMKNGFDFANKVVYENSSKKENYQGMGTTLIGIIIEYNNITVGHIGDSRLYHINKNNIKQITTDHTYINELIKKGVDLDSEEIRLKSNIITKAVGINDQIDADIISFKVVKSDYLLLCSDGLTGELTDEEIQEIVVEDDIEIEEKMQKIN